MMHSGVGRVGAGLGPEVVVGGRVPCILRLVGLVRACVGQEVVVCVCLLCRLLRGQTHLSMHSAVGRVGAGVVLGVMVGVLFFFAFLWSVVGLVVEGVGAKCGRFCCAGYSSGFVFVCGLLCFGYL